MNNEYLPFRSEILEVIKHADVEYTFRMAYDRGKEHPVKPGQFFDCLLYTSPSPRDS